MPNKKKKVTLTTPGARNKKKNNNNNKKPPDSMIKTVLAWLDRATIDQQKKPRGIGRIKGRRRPHGSTPTPTR